MKLSTNSIFQPEESLTINGLLYQLVVIKISDRSMDFRRFKQKYVKCHYIAESGTGIRAIEVKVSVIYDLV